MDLKKFKLQARKIAAAAHENWASFRARASELYNEKGRGIFLFDVADPIEGAFDQPWELRYLNEADVKEEFDDPSEII